MPKVDVASAADYLPVKKTLSSLRTAAADCRGCPLYRNATQTVFGEGESGAPLMLVGEQPGDQEDRQGHPFVGPAGRLLDELLEAAGIPGADVYVTNAVKHFKWKPSGTRRLHAKPSSREMKACRPWLEAEIEVVKPALIVCLGATAAQQLLGREFRVTCDRGKTIETLPGLQVMTTYHPSAVLRAPDSTARESMRKELLADLRQAKKYLGRSGSRG